MDETLGHRSPATAFPDGSFVLAAIGLGSGFALHYKKRVREVTEAVTEPVNDLQTFALLLERLEKEQWKTEKLRHLRAALDANGQPPSKEIHKLVRLMDWLNSRLNPFFAGIIGPLLLWSTQFAFAIEEWRAQDGAAIGRWLDAVGELEALCSLSAYAYEHASDPFPEVIEGSTLFDADDLRHPLLPASQCIPNSLKLDRDRQLLLISGSNMSGKSTLMRTVGVNVVLALAGAPVRAKRMRVSVLSIGATIRVVDSLQQGTSRFYAEIQRLRRIMDLTRNMPVLFLLDEILHGTNSHDRAVGAEAVIRGLLARGAIGLVTTHDLALVKLAETLGPQAANFHFQDHLEDGRMVFDYRLRPGIIEKSNALELMRAVGLEV
jgi:DNA mismatch repair ATPase MutS